MIAVKGYAAEAAQATLKPFNFDRREPDANDVQIDILYCGVCHSDIHQARDEWGGAIFPMVPGHEIVGKVARVGERVTRFAEGDLVGVGCLVDSCRRCASCRDHQEQYCENGFVGTYNSYEKDGRTPTYGGYSSAIVVDERFVLSVPTSLDLKAVAPLLCAGITTYSPLRHWKVGAGQKVGVVGLGGLGHMAVKFAKAFGASTVAFTTSPAKSDDAKRLGADEVVISKDPQAMAAQVGTFDFILDTVSAPHNINDYSRLLKRDGALVLVGLPEKALSLDVLPLVVGRKTIAGSLIGGLAETQEMLNFCGEHGITADVEVIAMHEINEAFERMLQGDVKYRFVIDMKTLES